MICLHAKYVDLKLGNFGLELLIEVSNRLKRETEVKDIKEVTTLHFECTLSVSENSDMNFTGRSAPLTFEHFSTFL